MSYFKTSYSTLQELAKSGRYEDVAGFLVLARHASGLQHGDFEPYKLSGAGVNSIHDKAGVSEEVARGVMQRLQERGVIRPATPEAKKVFFHARWEIVQGPLDLDLPHAFTDQSKDGTVSSALRRLRKHRTAGKHYAEKLAKVSDTELRLDALMVLLGIYRHTHMQQHGGLSPRCVYRRWKVESQTPMVGNIRWGAEPAHESNAHAYFVFMSECLSHVDTQGKKGTVSDENKDRFWNGWNASVNERLLYEAVCLYDADPETNDKGALKVTIRINDFHAGSVTKNGDPSLLRELENHYGNRLAFYTNPVNDRGEPESMWVVLPDKQGALVGIWRPRFRASTQDAGLWIEQEKAAITDTLAKLVAHAPAVDEIDEIDRQADDLF